MNNNLKVARKLLLVLALVIIFTNVVGAVPPVTTVQEFSEGLIIITSPQQYIKQNTQFTVNFWVYNISNGGHIDNTTVNCSFYLADAEGDLLVNGAVDFNENDYWDFVIGGGNFSEIGEHDWGIDCHNTLLGGATTGAYIINSIGVELDESDSIIYLGLLAILIFTLFALFFGMAQLPSSDTRDEEGKLLQISYLKHFRLVFWLAAYFLFTAIIYLSSNLAFAYLGEQLFADLLFAIFSVLMAVSPVIVVVIVISFFVRFFHDRQFQQLLNRGIFPQGNLP